MGGLLGSLVGPFVGSFVGVRIRAVGWSVGRLVVGRLVGLLLVVIFFEAHSVFEVVCGLTFRVKASKSLMRQNSHRIHLHDKKMTSLQGVILSLGSLSHHARETPFHVLLPKFFSLHRLNSESTCRSCSPLTPTPMSSPYPPGRILRMPVPSSPSSQTSISPPSPASNPSATSGIALSSQLESSF